MAEQERVTHRPGERFIGPVRMFRAQGGRLDGPRRPPAPTTRADQ
jgi:hypothetical protein